MSDLSNLTDFANEVIGQFSNANASKEPILITHVHLHDEMPTAWTLWLYGMASVVFISILGLMAIMSIPRIGMHHHQDVMQLLVGLAIGTLTSDALLHLLPHAFSGQNHSHDEEKGGHDSHAGEEHTKNIMYGLMALSGIIGFLTFERILTIVTDLASKPHKTTKVSNCDKNVESDMEKVDPLAMDPLLKECNEKAASCDEKVVAPITEESEVSCINLASDGAVPMTTEQCHRETMVYQHPDPDRGYVIQLMDHHHHHQHNAGHKSGRSVIYMIVTGDGVHNFFDGLAIGIAFAGGVAGGFSTSVAVLCHELPHEVGDFAVLLKAGLNPGKAVMYNAISAVLCLLGMSVGILIHTMDTALLSSAIAGMFLYIALVDMIPQLDCCPTADTSTRAFKLTVQVCGMFIGIFIMTLISIYEPSLTKILS